jgi:uncharacterized membrane protein YraQ (UPF0718 family)
MVAPVYAVTGFLGAGKTSFLNSLLGRSDWGDMNLLVIQFESGEVEIAASEAGAQILRFPRKILEQQPEQVLCEIRDRLQNGGIDEVWVEWNGLMPFSQLQALFLHPALRGLCKISRVIHIADAAALETLLGRTGSALPEQIANSDFALVRNALTAADLSRIRKLLRSVNPGVRTCRTTSYDDFYRQIFGKKRSPVNWFFLLTALMAAAYFAAAPLLERAGVPANRIVNIFLGIILQAVPFLLIGVLLSAVIQIFVSKEAIERRFPRTVGAGMLTAILAGFCLPVCDCASIPIFRSLVRKGIPLPVAVTFMAAAPVINPVVILSTWYAFSGNVWIVAERVCIGIVAAVLIGLTFSRRPPKNPALAGGALDRLLCGCGCYEDVESITGFSAKAGLFFRHAQAEFFNMGKFLVAGTFLSAVFQTMGTGAFAAARSGAGLALSLVFMMCAGFLLSLCSSSDAVVARSFANQFPMGALMGFLVFGPMMDVKNALMLSACFSRGFIVRLAVTMFLVCFGIVFLFFSFGGV